MIKELIKTPTLIIVISVLFCTSNLYSQNKLSADSPKNKANSSMLSVYIGSPVMNKLKIQNEGKPLLNSKYTLAPLIELDYSKNIYKTYGLKIGSGFNFVPFNTNFSFYVDQDNGISEELFDSQYEYNIVNFNLYFLLNKNFKISNEFSTSIELGIQYNYISNYSLPISIGYSYYDQNSDTTLNFLSFMIYHNDNCFSFKGNISFRYNLNKRNTLIAGLTFNYSPVYIADGYYYFNNLPWESYGTIELGINHMGLKIGYGYSF